MAFRSLYLLFFTKSETFINLYLNKLSDNDISDLKEETKKIKFKPDDMLALRLIQANTDENSISLIIKELSSKSKQVKY